MRAEFEFDPKKAEALGYSPEGILATLQRAFQAEGFRCASEWPVIVFEGTGHEDDFSNMWILLTGLANSGWFMQTAAACRWYDLSDNGEEELCEDVLSQAALLMRPREEM